MLNGMEFISKNYEDTFNFAKEFAKKLKKGDIKTAFVSGLAKGLDISEIVQSPTFTIVNEYKSGKIPLYHFDVYRIMSVDEMYDIGFDEYLFGGGICAVEWADNIREMFDMPYIEIKILKDLSLSSDYRKIIVTPKNGKVF